MMNARLTCINERSILGPKSKSHNESPPESFSEVLDMSLSTTVSWGWILSFSAVDFANRVVFGAFGTLLGPSQPYLAENVDVGIDTITLLSTFGKMLSDHN